MIGAPWGAGTGRRIWGDYIIEHHFLAQLVLLRRPVSAAAPEKVQNTIHEKMHK